MPLHDRLVIRIHSASVGPRRAVAGRGESGGAMAELALIMPIFIALIIGSVEFGSIVYANIEVSSAARAGVQYGAQNHNTAADTSGMQSAATGDGSNVAGIAAVATTFCTCSDGTTITCANAATTCLARTTEYVKVTTTATVTPAFHVVGTPASYTVKGLAVMRVQQ